MAYDTVGEDLNLSQYAKVLRSYLRVYHRRLYAVDDLVQDTFVQAFHTIRTHGPPTKPLAWLLTIASVGIGFAISLAHYRAHRKRGE